MDHGITIAPVALPETVPDGVLAEVSARIARFDHTQWHHPRHAFATHVVAMLGATICAMANGNDGSIDADFGRGTLDHACADSLNAALWLIGTLFRAAGMDEQDIARAIPEYAERALTP